MSLESNKIFVSRVVGQLKALSKDGRISRRLVLSVGKDKARMLMSQKLDEMTLFKEDGIISHIGCFPMNEISTKECDIFEFNLCETVMKSKFKIPYTIFGKNGAGIISVTNVDRTVRYDYITPQRYDDLLKRKDRRKSSHFYTIQNEHIYLPDSTNELIEISMIALNKWELPIVSSCSNQDECQSYWEYDFVCPNRLYESVITNTVQELAGTWASIVGDTNPNMDPNLKTKTNK